MLKDLDTAIEYITTHKAKLIISAIMISLVVGILVPDSKTIIINNIPALPQA